MALMEELDAMVFVYYNQNGMFSKETCDYFWSHYRATEGSPKARFQMFRNQLWNLENLYA